MDLFDSSIYYIGSYSSYILFISSLILLRNYLIIFLYKIYFYYLIYLSNLFYYNFVLINRLHMDYMIIYVS